MITGKAIVKKIEERTTNLLDRPTQYKMAILDIDNQEVEVMVEDGTTKNEYYRYFNLNPHRDWICEGMTVYLHADMDGYYIMSEERHNSKPHQTV